MELCTPRTSRLAYAAKTSLHSLRVARLHCRNLHYRHTTCAPSRASSATTAKRLPVSTMMWLPPTSCILSDTSNEHTTVRPTLLPSTIVQGRGIVGGNSHFGEACASQLSSIAQDVCSIIMRDNCKVSLVTLFQARFKHGTISISNKSRTSPQRHACPQILHKYRASRLSERRYATSSRASVPLAGC
eukprot:6212288-Pleurochrysis_carterae.AAC.3